MALDCPRALGGSRHTRLTWRMLGIALLLFAVVGCGSSASGETSTVTIAVLPDQEDAQLRSQYEPLLTYLSEEAGLRTQLIIPDTYEDLVALFDSGAIDLAWLGGLTFLQADLDGEADPLAMRDIDLEFTSDILVSADAPGESIHDFMGSDFAFGPELSTSGHLMPRYFIENKGLSPETLFATVLHSSGHDETARWVRDGLIDIGAANSAVVESMFESGELSTETVRVLERTNPYRDYVWATSSNLDEQTRDRLLDAFLALDMTNDEHADILGRFGAEGFVPATRNDFVELRDVATEYGFIGSDGG